MTRGYVVLLIGGKLYKVVESYSDSYLSNLGLQVLSLFEKHKLEEALNNVQPIYEPKEELSTDDAIDLIWEKDNFKSYNSVNGTMDWFITNKNSANDYFYDYSYIYDTKKDVLKVYYYGKILFTIHREEIPFYKYLFENENKLYPAIVYDEKICSLNKDWEKEIRKFCKNNNSIDAIDSFINNFKPKIYIINYKITDCWDNSYKKEIRDIDNDSVIATFIISKNYKKGYNLCIQYPYIRDYVFVDSKTTAPRSSERELIRIVKENESELLNFAKVVQLYTTSIKTIEQKPENSIAVYVDSFKKELEALVSKPYFHTSTFDKTQIIYSFTDNIQRIIAKNKAAIK